MVANNLLAIVAIVGVFVGCCSNVIFLEMLIKHDPGSGNLITFCQFAFIAIEGFICTHKLGQKRPRIGLRDYFYLVVMFFIVSVCNNYAFDFNIPMPLHMIFRAGSLIANMVMGMLLLGKRYPMSKYVAVLLITFGIALCTLISGAEIKQTKGTYAADTVVESNPTTVFFHWVLGITLLTVALFISAAMGIYQEKLYAKHGKHPYEALYYTHLMPLPGFLLFYSNISEHLGIVLDSAVVSLPLPFLPSLSIPIQLVYLIGNVLTQFICIAGVYVLTTECQSLTVTLVVTLRKFTSLIFSIVYFKNEFTLFHWLGTVCVFYGTIIFTDLIPSVKKSLQLRSSKDQSTISSRNSDSKSSHSVTSSTKKTE